MQDLVNTREFRQHKTFFFSCVINASSAIIVWFILSFHLNNLYRIIFNAAKYSYIIWYPFVLVTIVNNLYQVFAHIFTATTFTGSYVIIPYGSHKKQTLLDFTVSNIFDILGWICIFVYFKCARPFPALLAATHFGAALVSIIQYKTFQDYYIDSAKNIRTQYLNSNDEFRYGIWRGFKASFVMTDAIVRGSYTAVMLLNVIQ